MIPDTATVQPNPLLNSAQKKGTETKTALCSQRPLMVFQTISNENGKLMESIVSAVIIVPNLFYLSFFNII